MSRTARVRDFFGDGEHDFRLAVEQLIELQEETDCGLLETQQRIVALRVKDIRLVLRLGLIGGGMPKEQAFRLVERHVVAGYLTTCAGVAAKVVSAAAQGVEEDKPEAGEQTGATERSAPLFPEAESAGAISTATPAPAASAAATSSTARSGKSPRKSRAGTASTAPSQPAP